MGAIRSFPFYKEGNGKPALRGMIEKLGEFIATELTVEIQCFGIVQMLIPFLGSDAPFLHLVVFEQYVGFVQRQRQQEGAQQEKRPEAMVCLLN